MSRLSLFQEVLLYMRHHKRWWLAPLIVLVVVLAVFITFAEGSALAPLIYALF
jgi:hypothetical protein